MEYNHIKVCTGVFFNLFILWLCWIFTAAHGLSPVLLSGGHSQHRRRRLFLRRLLLLWLTGCGCTGFSSCSPRALEHGLSNWATWALVAPWRVESSLGRDWTHVPCTGRWSPIHCTTREVLYYFVLFVFLSVQVLTCLAVRGTGSSFRSLLSFVRRLANCTG